jgi:hypothetical protein
LREIGHGDGDFPGIDRAAGFGVHSPQRE